MGCSNSKFLTATDARNESRNYALIYQEICAIQQAILTASSNCAGNSSSYGVLINGDSPITSHYGIRQVLVNNGGTGYVVAEPALLLTSGTGSGFTGTANVDQLTGTVVDITITDPGLTYTVGDAFSIIGVTGQDFDAEVSQVDGTTGEVTGVIINDGGTGYFNEPHLVISDPNSGAGFIGNVNVTAGAISSIDIIEDGQNYSSSTTVTVSSTSGSGAVLTLLMDSQKWMEIPFSEDYFKVWANLETDTAIQDQIEYIQSYFVNLGYNFIIQVNPDTMNTLQWQISW